MGSALSLRILVVDDDEAVCAATTGMLESLGHHVDGETDSLTALSVFSKNVDEFDIAVIEPMLPGLTGLDLALSLRRIRPGFPVLFYAGYADESLLGRMETDRLGQIAFKPFRLKELAAAIEDRLSPGPAFHQNLHSRAAS